MTFQRKRILFSKLLRLLQQSDSLSIELEAELLKSKAFDRASLILTGLSATIAIVLEQIEAEIILDIEKLKISQEPDRLSPPC